LFDASLSAKGSPFTSWTWTRALPPANYGLSVRAVDSSGRVEKSTPWVVFTVRS
jgi:hypothetical protein